MRLHSCRAPDQTQTVSLLPYHWRLPCCCRVHQHQTKSCTGHFQDTDVDKNDLIYLSLSSSSSQHDHPAGSPCPLSVSSLSLQDPSGSQALTGSSPSFFSCSRLQSLRLNRVRNTWTRTQHQQRNTKTERKERWIECHGSKVFTLSLYNSFHIYC